MHDINEMLNYINPAELSYQEWVNVGMALKAEGFTAADWDAWSRNDTRYKSGECFRKWGTFQRSGAEGVSGGTIYEYAVRGGYAPKSTAPDRALEWDAVIQDKDDLQIVDKSWLEEVEIEEPGDDWDPVKDITTYLQTLFQSTENVGYVTDVYEAEDRLSPKRGSWDRTAGELIEALKKHRNIGAVFGDPHPVAGAWIRFNPLDGNGVKNDNVTDFRYALVESDSMSLGKQNAIMRELELPIAALVFSGKKSIHAIVRVEASDYSEYRKRVDYLYQVCEKNGLKVDTQNKNPSRLSRMPGVVRNGHKQFLIATNIGKKSWDEWREWIEGINDDLPDPECLADIWSDLPPLADCLIDGVLRQGHKMLLAGPSKAGKSFLLMELTIAIAEGAPWIGFQCARGRVLYVNLELDRASCLHRFKDVYKAMGIPPEHFRNIEIWNLRGKAVPMDKLAPKLIRRAEKKGYSAVIIDPIYKVITGDENSADQMANFCNQFDKICTALQAAVIYCHHHSKGAQGGKKSMDRASGSGVFARDPDALLDLTELELTKELQAQQEGKARIRAILRALDEFAPGWKEDLGPDDLSSPSVVHDYAVDKLGFDKTSRMTEYIAEEVSACKKRTAWRIEGTLREFAPLEPMSLWFDYPIHKVDTTGVLSDLTPEAELNGYQKMMEIRKEQAKEARKAALDELVEAYNELLEDAKEGGKVALSDIAELVGRDIKELGKWFGKGKNSRPEYKKVFIRTVGDDRKTYLVRRGNDE